MKKLFVIALAISFIAGMFATAYAEERLSLDGSYRVRAWFKENYADFDDNDNDDELYYWRQRFRLGGVINVAEGITANFRVDLSEVTWGEEVTKNRLAQSPTEEREMDVDRAFVRWEKDFWVLNVGQAATSFGNQIAVDQQHFGFIVRFKLPVVLDFVYAKVDESGDQEGGVPRNDDGDNDDIDFFGGQATYKADWWDVGILAAVIDDKTDENNSPFGIGVFGGLTYGMFAFKGEADFFGGDSGSRPDGAAGTADAKGAQIWADVKANIMPNLYAGLEGFYAASYTGGDERQITGITDNGSFMPEDWGSSIHTGIGPMNGLGAALGGTGTNIPIFDPSGQSAGGIGFSIYGNWRFMDKWQLRAKYLYSTPDSSKTNVVGRDRNNLDNVNVFNIGLIWDCLPNTTARVGYNWTGPNEKSGFSALDPAQALVGMLQLTW